MSKEELFTKIKTLPPWQGQFEFNETDHAINLINYGQVENLIDLLDERYICFDVTDQEYDTRAKNGFRLYVICVYKDLLPCYEVCRIQIRKLVLHELYYRTYAFNLFFGGR